MGGKPSGVLRRWGVNDAGEGRGADRAEGVDECRPWGTLKQEGQY